MNQPRTPPDRDTPADHRSSVDRTGRAHLARYLPILTIVVAGTSAGAFIGEHCGIAALTLTGLLVLSVTRLLRAFRGRS